MPLPPLFIVTGIGTLCGLLMILERNPLRSALYLIFSLLSVAMVFISLQAEFLGMLQIILYAGAIMVLIIFVILLTTIEETKRSAALHRQTPIAILLALGLLVEFIFLFKSGSFMTATAGPRDSFSLEGLAEALFTHYLLPFEIASILLLVSLVATIVLAKKESSP